MPRRSYWSAGVGAPVIQNVPPMQTHEKSDDAESCHGAVLRDVAPRRRALQLRCDDVGR
eukprot:gene28752-3526_t